MVREPHVGRRPARQNEYVGTDPSRLDDAPRLTALAVLRRVFGGPKLLLLLMAVWTIGGAILAVNVGDHLGKLWGLTVGIVVLPLGLSRMMKASLRRQ